MTGNTEIQTVAAARRQIDANPHITVRSAKSTGRFAVQFDKERFEMALMKAGSAFREVTDELNAEKRDHLNIGESVYETPIGVSDIFVLRVYSTVRTYSTTANRRGTSRRKGDDAIRCHIVHTPTEEIVAAAPKTLRIATVDDDGDVVQNWEKNLLRKIEEWTQMGILAEATECKECSHANTPAEEQGHLIEREGEYGKLLGCTNYDPSKEDDGCTNIVNL